MFIYLMEWLLIMFGIYGKHVAEPGWPTMVRTNVVRQRFRVTDFKLQGLVHVAMKT